MSLSNTFAHKGRQFIRYPKGIAVFLPNIYKSEESMHSSFLVGYDGQLFEIGCDFSVLHVSEPYLATGSGWAFASGALHSMASLPPKERITKALEAAAHYNCYVRPPFTILSDTDDT